MSEDVWNQNLPVGGEIVHGIEEVPQTEGHSLGGVALSFEPTGAEESRRDSDEHTEAIQREESAPEEVASPEDNVVEIAHTTEHVPTERVPEHIELAQGEADHATESEPIRIEVTTVGKEEAMQAAEAARNDIVDWKKETPREVGERHDISVVGEKIGAPLTELLANAPDTQGRAIAYIKFGGAMADHYESAGDSISLNLRALREVGAFTDGWPHRTEQAVDEEGTKMHITLQGETALVVTKETADGSMATWSVPMFDSDPEGRAAHTGDGHHAYYEKATDKAGNARTIEEVHALSEDDVAALRRLFDTVRDYSEQQRESESAHHDLAA
ncbi:MAG: hypothetical protein WAS27_01975 [Candidatus Saccharimonadales bacterium]